MKQETLNALQRFCLRYNCAWELGYDACQGHKHYCSIRKNQELRRSLTRVMGDDLDWCVSHAIQTATSKLSDPVIEVDFG